MIKLSPGLSHTFQSGLVAMGSGERGEHDRRRAQSETDRLHAVDVFAQDEDGQEDRDRGVERGQDAAECEEPVVRREQERQGRGRAERPGQRGPGGSAGAGHPVRA
jgi:hypothetical protein